MKSVGIFEAKTHFPSLCEQVVSSGRSVVVKKRGRPLVVISPVEASYGEERPDIYSAWREWQKQAGKADPDYPEVWKMRNGQKPNPLAE